MRTTTVSNTIDQITFEKSEGGEVEMFINDIYVTTLSAHVTNDRGWDELRNLGNKECVGDQYDAHGDVINSWMEK